MDGEVFHYGPDPGHGGLTKHDGTRADCSGPDCGVDPLDDDWTDEDELRYRERFHDEPVNDERDADDGSWRFGRCEVSVGVTSDRAGKPLVIMCRLPGEWRADVGVRPFGAITCDDCHEKIKVARSRTRTRDHDDEVTDG